jgi:uncharacterized membrane protein
VKQILENPWNCLWLGFALAILMAALSLATAGSDVLGFVSLLIRWLHVLAAIVWVGLVVFVNFVQLVAVTEADEDQRGFIAKAIVARVASWFRHASTVTVAAGMLLLLAGGYVLPNVIYGSGVFVPPARSILLWVGALGGIAMWTFVHMFIWPAMQVVLGLRAASTELRLRSFEKVRIFARLNLVLAVPVTFAMVAAAHLF